MIGVHIWLLSRLGPSHLAAAVKNITKYSKKMYNDGENLAIHMEDNYSFWEITLHF